MMFPLQTSLISPRKRAQEPPKGGFLLAEAWRIRIAVRVQAAKKIQQ